MNLGVNPMCLTSSAASWKSNDGVSDQFPAGLRVLVVDDDPTCLRILEKMLRNCCYEVTKCCRAEIALKFLRDNKDGFDIVISDVHMPDMDGFKLLEQVGLEMDLPVIMMSADDSKNVVMKGVTHGACDYLIKPVRMEALKNIWQHVVRKRKHEWRERDLEQSGSMEDVERQQKPSEDVDYSSSANEGNWKSSKKRKDEEDEVEERDDISNLKKPRVVWSVELHQQFVTAVNQLGIDKAVPKKILELMDVPGLTRENVASHLQKYRLYLRRLSGQHQNGLGSSFAGPQDTPFGPITSFNGLDLQALASSGRLAPQSLASIQAAAIVRATSKSPLPVPLIDELYIFSHDNSKIRFVEGQQQHNNGKQVNLLHGIPTNMNLKQLAALHQSAQSFSNINTNINSQSGQSNSLLTQLFQPKSRTQILNEISSSHSSNRPSSAGQTVLSEAIPQPVLDRYGIGNVCGPPDTYLSKPSIGVDFSRIQGAELPGNTFPPASNSGLTTFGSKGMVQEYLNTGMKGSRSFVAKFDVVNELNQNRNEDLGLQSSIGSTFEAPKHSNVDVAPSVLVQPGFSTDQRSGHTRTPSVSSAFSNTADFGQQLSSSRADSSLRIGPEGLPDTGFQNGIYPVQFAQDALMSSFLKQHQEGMVPVENEFGFEEYHLDNLPV